MKRYLFLLRLSLLIALVAMGCRPVVQTDYRKVIPEESAVLVAIKAERLAEKSGGRWQSLLENNEAAMPGIDWQKILMPLLENDDLYGLDLAKNIYLFGGPEEGVAGGVAAVSDYTRLQESFLRMEREGLAGPLTEKNGTQRTMLENGLFCVFNEHLLFCVTGKEKNSLQKLADKQLSGKQRADHLQPGFREFLADNNDVSMLFKGGHWEGFAAHIPTPGADPSKLTLLLGLSFEEGKATLSYQHFTADPETEAALARYLAAIRPITTRFLSRYPADLLGYATANVEGRTLYEQIRQAGVLDELYLPAKGQQLLQSALNAVDGDVSMGVTGVMPMGIPVILLYAECRDAGAVEELRKWGEQQFGQVAELRKTGDHQYEIQSFLPPMTVYLGWKNGVMYLTNSSEHYRNLDRAITVSLDRSPLTAGWGTPAAGWLLNIASLMKLPMVQLFVYQQIPPQHLDEFKRLTEQLSHCEILSDKSGKTVWNIYLKEQQGNSLPLFLDLGRLIAGIF